MKFYLRMIIAAILSMSLSSCIVPEKIETRIRYFGEKAPSQITCIWHNISSTAENDKDLKKDFDDFIEDLEDSSTTTELSVGSETKIIVQSWHASVEYGKLNLKMIAVPAGDKLEDLSANGERMIVLEKEEGNESIETNGKLLETEENYIIVWPERLEEIYWIVGGPKETSEEKNSELQELARQNHPKLIKMFEAYQEKKRRR